MNFLPNLDFDIKRRIKVVLTLILFPAILQGCDSAPTPRTGEIQNASSNQMYSVPASFFDEPIKVIVSPKEANVLAAEFGRMGRPGVIRYLYELELEDDGTLQAIDAFQSVIYVVLGSASVGTKFDTSYTYTRSSESVASKPTDRPFTQGFHQTVERGMSVNPTIIINEAYSVYKGDFLFWLYKNGVKTFSRRIIVPNDAG